MEEACKSKQGFSLECKPFAKIEFSSFSQSRKLT